MTFQLLRIPESCCMYHSYLRIATNMHSTLYIYILHALQKICEMSGWKPGAPRYLQVHELFKEIWRKLQDDGDADFDGKISQDEWVGKTPSLTPTRKIPFLTLTRKTPSLTSFPFILFLFRNY